MTDKKDDALKLALEALEYISSHYMSLPKIGCMALAVVEEALAEPAQQQEPAAVARVDDLERGGRVRALAMGLGLDAPLYTTPPQRKPLTDEQIKRMAAKWFLSMYWPLCNTFARAIEAAHGIKGDE